MVSSLVPQVVVIAGVGPDLGTALARRFAREGCRVAMLARSAGFLRGLAEELNALQRDAVALALPCDLTDPAQVARAFKEVRAVFGPADVLINNAAAREQRDINLLGLESDVFEQAWRVGTHAAFICSREAARDMLAPERHEPRGAILFTGATSSVRGARIAFSSAKFAARGLAQALARELWPKGIHLAHVVINGIIREAGSDSPPDADGAEPLLHPAAIAAAYWQLVQQDRTAWAFELDLRPHRESFFE